MSQFNTDFDPASSLLAAGIAQMTTESTMFSDQMEIARSESLTSLTLSREACDELKSAAVTGAVAQGMSATASLSSGLCSARTARQMGKIDVETQGSQSFQDSHVQAKSEIDALSNQRDLAGERQVTVITRNEAGGNATVTKNLGEVTPTEVEGLRTQSARIEQALNSNTLQPAVAQRLQTRKTEIDGNIAAYDEYKQLDGQVTDKTQRQNVASSDEYRRVSDNLRMKGDAQSQLASGVVNLVASPLTYASKSQEAEADETKAEAGWASSEASAFRTLGESAQSGSQSPIEYITSANETTAAVINELSKVPG